MIAPCPIRIECPSGAEGDSPVRNISAEAPDLPVYTGNIVYAERPRLGYTFIGVNGNQICVSTTSQEEADLCASNLAQQNVLEDWVAPPIPGLNYFNSTAQTCTVNCIYGTPVSYTAPAGSQIGLNQADADAAAYSLACSIANTLCSNQASPPAGFGSAAQTGTFKCTDGQTKSISVPANLFYAPTQAQANQQAMDFAVLTASMGCPYCPTCACAPSVSAAYSTASAATSTVIISLRTAVNSVNYDVPSTFTAIDNALAATVISVASLVVLAPASLAATIQAAMTATSEAWAEDGRTLFQRVNALYDAIPVLLASLNPIPSDCPPDGGGINPDPNAPGGGNVVVYSNTQQTCVVECAQGGTFSWTIPAGVYLGISQANANAIANSVACNMANENKLCLSALTPDSTTKFICVDVFRTLTFTAYGLYSNAGNIWTLDSGTLPTGMELSDASGVTAQISGTPTVMGLFAFVLKCVQTNGSVQTQSYVVEVGGIITGSALQSGYPDEPYSETIEVLHMALISNWAVTSGSLPNGLTLNSITGIISGIPTQVEEQTFTITATDSEGDSCSKEFTIGIEIVEITTASPLTDGFLETAYSQQFDQTGLTPTVNWQLISGSLPTGLSLSSSGLLSGTPTEDGVFNFIVQAMDAFTDTNKAFQLTISVPDPFSWSPTWGAPSGGNYSTILPPSVPANEIYAAIGVDSGPPSSLDISGTQQYTGPLRACNLHLVVNESGDAGGIIEISVGGVYVLEVSNPTAGTYDYPFDLPVSVAEDIVIHIQMNGDPFNSYNYYCTLT